jgi:hypothetical protein
MSVKVELLLMRGPDDEDPPKVLSVDLPEAPIKGDNLSHEGRAYVVLSRSWVTEPRSLEGVTCWGMRCALLVRQIDGPPHVEATLMRPGLKV